VKQVLERHSDGTVNFGVKLLTGTGPGDQVDRATLRSAAVELFGGDEETVLFYFAGHGYLDSVGGYLLTTDSRSGDAGISVSELMQMANASKSQNKVIVLDSCHSGIAGQRPGQERVSELSEGLTVLTASTAEQYAQEEAGGGVFTTLLVDALNGSAANLVGDVTPGSVYAHIDQSLGAWNQRPVFKTNVKTFVSLRKVQPPLPLSDLRRIAELFPAAGFHFRLDPSFEPEGPCPDPRNTERFDTLRRLNRVNLVVPVGAPHMYHAAMGSHACSLTVLGEHYRRLAVRNLI
jgi:hypothetical protein